ncbi:unnamed protein product [Darwinula stevensoni]|uniref:AP-3 complex subunit beta n=1 Tax=Darwinula stevensoni TaxID=69355 RepID=A0A7R8X293_9CRUS|nr:unnamed protein product [Darwinula stevensoni]CAG0883112.1 unnamed protein product [Darwinula stevensoni]
MSASPYNDYSGSGDTEYGQETLSGSTGFFTADYKRHDDLKNMLDSNKDSLKLEAMKRIIGMVAKGRDASDLFPAVVKNVVSKNIEVKKLVYVYLVRYAEDQQDLALLSISTFQRALKDPNQLIRASALRVLSSIRVPVIVPIMMLAIKDGVSDMSPYVRKAAAHAIPKLYVLDPEQKEELMGVIEKLLSDRTTLVMGSAVMAFEDVCPERTDLIHKTYRKLCNLLTDVEEWGQVIIINMLTRYARSQFADPTQGALEDPNRPFYDSDDADKDEEDHTKEKAKQMDPDHRLLLQNTRPLLQSRNASVVMAVAQLYYHCAPQSEFPPVVKALIRLLRSRREVQSIVLNVVAAMSTKRKGLFEHYMKSFYVRSTDPTHIKLLKLEILTNLATESNISLILRELGTYIGEGDPEFVAASIHSIARCASEIKEVADTCLNGLVLLLSNPDEAVVAESVVVIRKLLQLQPSHHKDIITQMAKMVDTITVPNARASILWLLGEYSERVPGVAPDVLRKMAKVFIEQEDIVKLQILNLAVKLYVTNPEQTSLLTQYILNLGKYDQSYDIRDRTRFFRAFIFPVGDAQKSQLVKYAKKIFLTNKPPPIIESRFKDREEFQIGTLSNYINAKAMGYWELPAFPEVPPDPSVRNVEIPSSPSWPAPARTARKPHTKGKTSKVSFYSESEEEGEEEENEGEESSEEEENEESSSEEESEEGSSEEESEEAETPVKPKPPAATPKKADEPPKKKPAPVSESESEETESNEESSSSEEEALPKSTPKKKPESPPKSNLDLLMDLDFGTDTSFSSPMLMPHATLPSTPSKEMLSAAPTKAWKVVPAVFVPTTYKTLLSRTAGGGCEITYRFTRTPNLYSPRMISVELVYTNMGDEGINESISVKNVGNEDFKAPSVVSGLQAQRSASGTMGIDPGESTQPLKLEIAIGGLVHPAQLVVPIGERVRPLAMDAATFTAERSKLKGMNENRAKVKVAPGRSLSKDLLSLVNAAPIGEDHRFACQTVSSECLILVGLEPSGEDCTVVVNCEKMVLASMLLKEIREGLAA